MLCMRVTPPPPGTTPPLGATPVNHVPRGCHKPFPALTLIIPKTIELFVWIPEVARVVD